MFQQLNLNQEQILCLENFQARDGFCFLCQNEEQQILDLFSEFDIYQSLFPILTDHNSNFWCIYTGGALKGMVCYLSHDELSLEPKFYDLCQLINAIAENPEVYDYDEFDQKVFDFPLINKPNNLSFKQIKLELYQQLENSIDEDIIRQISFSIMALIIADDKHEFDDFLKSEDEYIVERASKLKALKMY